MAVCFKENQRILSHFLRMWWKYERTSFSAVGAYTFRADCSVRERDTGGQAQCDWMFDGDSSKA
jgi:hypothetical protein